MRAPDTGAGGAHGYIGGRAEGLGAAATGGAKSGQGQQGQAG